MLEEFYNDDIKAIDARFEAQKIAFAPIIFQVSKCMIDFNILKIIEEAGDAAQAEHPHVPFSSHRIPGPVPGDG